ncbi:MAG: ArsR family transcriptional regulator [Pseudomonadales bacterium]|nr:ArsR family transcriptional regulator [Pseudomonadales bacterium]
MSTDTDTAIDIAAAVDNELLDLLAAESPSGVDIGFLWKRTKVAPNFGVLSSRLGQLRAAGKISKDNQGLYRAKRTQPGIGTLAQFLEGSEPPKHIACLDGKYPGDGSATDAQTDTDTVAPASPAPAPATAQGKRHLGERILDLLSDQCCTRIEMATALNASSAAVAYHLTRLKKAGLIVQLAGAPKAPGSAGPAPAPVYALPLTGDASVTATAPAPRKLQSVPSVPPPANPSAGTSDPVLQLLTCAVQSAQDALDGYVSAVCKGPVLDQLHAMRDNARLALGAYKVASRLPVESMHDSDDRAMLTPVGDQALAEHQRSAAQEVSA